MYADSLIARAIYGVAAILVCHAVAEWTGDGYQFDVSAPNRSLDDLPTAIGQWQSSEVDLPVPTVDVIGAEAYINRMYRDDQGAPVGVHLAYWASPEYAADVAPHHPSRCYTGAGWEILESVRCEVDFETERLPFEMMLVEQNGQRLVTAHWYQMGPFRFTSRTDARGVHRQLWGQAQWPPTLKVLLQTPANSIDSARPRLEALAAELTAWTSEF